MRSTFSALLDPLSSTHLSIVPLQSPAGCRQHRESFTVPALAASGFDLLLCGKRGTCSTVHLRNLPWVQKVEGLPLLWTQRRSIEPNHFEKRPPAAAGCTTSAPSATRFSHMRKWLPLVNERVEGQPFVTREHDPGNRVTTWLTRVRWPLPPRRCYGRAAGSCGWLVFGLHRAQASTCQAALS